MARWRVGLLYQIPAVYWNLNPALSKGRPSACPSISESILWLLPPAPFPP